MGKHCSQCKELAAFFVSVVVGALFLLDAILFYYNVDTSFLDRTAPAEARCEECNGQMPILQSTALVKRGCPPANHLKLDTYTMYNETVSIFANQRRLAYVLGIYGVWVTFFLCCHDLGMRCSAKIIFEKCKQNKKYAGEPGRLKLLLFIIIYATAGTAFALGFGGKLIYDSLTFNIIGYAETYQNLHVSSACICKCGYRMAWVALAKLCLVLGITTIASCKLIYLIVKAWNVPVFLAYTQRIDVVTLYDHRKRNGGSLTPVFFETDLLKDLMYEDLLKQANADG